VPQYPFLQAMYVAAIVAALGIVLALPVGARYGPRAGRRVLRGTLVALVVALGACLLWGASAGDLAAFNARLGVDAWLQMVAFFGIVLWTGYHFVGRYLDDRAARERDAAAAAGGFGGLGDRAAAAADEPAAPDAPERDSPDA